MNESTKPVSIALAVHTKIVDIFNKSISFDKQEVRDSASPEYNIVTFETSDYEEVVERIQQNLPYVKVIMPIELDNIVRKNIENYDTQLLT